jgi:hypothetical protein
VKVNEKLSKATIVDGIAATEGRDSQGEILKLSGADIAQMTTKGYFNDNHGSGFLNTLGRITDAKKIFKREDCITDRQRHFFQQAGSKPYLYVSGYLFDDEDHPNAKAVAAIMKGFQKMGTPMDVKMSVEGKVVDRAPGGIIAESMVRNVALTLIPANGETAAGIAGSTIQKCLEDVKRSGGNVAYADSLIKSMGSFQVANRWENRDEVEVLNLIDKFNEIRDLIKMLAPGYGSAGPANTRVGQAALTTSSIQAKKAKLKIIAKSLLEKNPGMTLEKAVGLAVSQMAGEDLEKSGRKWRTHPNFSVSEDGNYIITKRTTRLGTKADKGHYTHTSFHVTHYPEGQANTKNNVDIGVKSSMAAAKAHVETHANKK